MEVVRWVLLVNLGVSGNSLRSLVTEVDLNLCACLPRLWRLNPELVVPCRSVAFSSSIIGMNYKYVIAIGLGLNSSGEGIPTTIVIHVNTLFLAPCTNLVVVLCVVETSVGISPRSLGITIGQLLNPFNRALLLLVVRYANPLPLNLSGGVGLCNEVTRRTTDAAVLPFNLGPFGAYSNRSTNLLARAPAPTHVDVHGNGLRGLNHCLDGVFAINLSGNIISNEILMPCTLAREAIVLNASLCLNDDVAGLLSTFNSGISVVTAKVGHYTVNPLGYITHYVEWETLISRVVNLVIFYPLSLCS